MPVTPLCNFKDWDVKYRSVAATEVLRGKLVSKAFAQFLAESCSYPPLVHKLLTSRQIEDEFE